MWSSSIYIFKVLAIPLKSLSNEQKKFLMAWPCEKKYIHKLLFKLQSSAYQGVVCHLVSVLLLSYNTITSCSNSCTILEAGLMCAHSRGQSRVTAWKMGSSQVDPLIRQVANTNLSHRSCIRCCNTPKQIGHCSSSMADSSCMGAREGCVGLVLSCEALLLLLCSTISAGVLPNFPVF